MLRPLRRRGVQLALILGVVYAVAYMSRGSTVDRAPADGTYTRILARGDGHYYYLGTLSLVFDHDVDVTNQYQTFGDPFGNLKEKQQPSGYPWTYAFGTSFLQLPFFALAHAGAAVANLLGADIPRHGYTLWHQRITFLGQLLAGYFAVLLGFRLARRHVPETAAFYAALAIGLGTAVYYYAAFSAGYGHAYSAFGVALLVDYVDATRGRHDARRWLVVGLLVGLASLSRLQEVLFAVLPAWEGIAELVRRLRARAFRSAAMLVGSFVLAAVAALVVVSPPLIANRIIYGSLFATGQAPHFMHWSAPFLWEPLFASRNGLFVWTPLAALATLGLALGVRRQPRLALLLGAGFFAQLWIAGSAWAWWADASFSIRWLVDVTAVLVLGLAFLVDALRALADRFPRAARHAPLVLALAPLVGLNLELAGAVMRGTQRTSDPVSPVALYADSVRRTLTTMEATVGLPTSWPASWIWALRHRCPPSRYNDVVGSAFLHFSPNIYRVRGRRTSERLPVNADTLARFGLGAWGAVQVDGGRRFAWASSGARLLIPLNIDDDVHLEVSVSAPAGTAATVRVNGRSWPFNPATKGFQTLVLDAPPVEAGTNELEIVCDGPRPPGTGCVALEYVDLVYQAR